MKQLLTLITILFLSSNIMAQVNEDAYNKAMTSALADMQAATTPAETQAVTNKFERIASNDNTHWQPSYYATFLQTVGAFEAKDKAAAGAVLETLTEEISAMFKLESVVADKKAQSEIHALIAMMYSARMMANPMVLGAKFGSLNGQYLANAIALNPDNPRAHLLEAQNLFYTPEAFGGDKAKANQYAQKSLILFNLEEKEAPVNYMPRWGKDQVEGLLKQME